MANRLLRFILDNDVEGTLQVDDPTKFEGMDLVLERDKKFFAISSELMEVDLGFHSQAREYLLNILATQGPDNETRIDLDVSIDKGQTYEDLFDGIFDWETFSEDFTGDDGYIVSITAVRSGFFARFMNHQDTEIDVNQVKDIYGDTRETINLNTLTTHSQTIRRQFDADDSGINEENLGVTVSLTTVFCEVNWQTENIVEIDKITNIATEGIILVTPTETLYTINEDVLVIDTVFEMEGQVSFRVVDTGGGTNISNLDAQWFVQRNSAPAVNIGPATLTTPGTPTAQVDHNIALSTRTFGSNTEEDEFRVYLKVDIQLAAGSESKDLEFDSFGQNININIHADTDFPEFNVNTFLVHELGNRIVNSITGTNSRFFSEYLGNRVTQIQSYTENGCGSYFACNSGNQLRGKNFNSAPWKLSFADYFDGEDGIFNLGLVVEDSGGSDRVRMEPKHFFFQSGSPLITLRDIDYERSIATEFIYKKVETGFNKWKSEDLNSIDDWSTNQVRTSRYATIGVDKDIKSNFIAASYAIEATRRKLTETKSWRLDNDSFIIALNRSVDGSDDPNNLGVAEKNENFITVNNILFPAVAYNLRLSPARNFLRWGNVANIGLVDYAASLWRWQGGEGNQDFESRIADGCEGSFNNDILIEKDDIQWDYSASPETEEQTPLFKPFWYRFTTELSFTDYKILRDNKTDSFEIIGKDGVTIEVFLWELSYNLFKGEGKFKAIEANV